MKKGKDVRIHKTAIFKRSNKVYIGDYVAIDPFFYMTPGGAISSYVHINSHVSVIGGEDGNLFIGNRTAISTGCRLICRSEDFTKTGHAIPWLREGHAPQYGTDIMIGDDVILGANVVVLPDSVIENGVTVGANSLVKGRLKANGIYAGIPAKKIGVRK